MAAVTPEVVEQAGKSAERKHQGPTSHGRGGAGNFGAAPNDVDPSSLETPTIKSKIYTTGRGGTGNMAKNDDPEEARRAQDVNAIARVDSSQGQHIGRGGGGNVVRPSKEDTENGKKNGDSAIADGSHEHKKEHKGGFQGLADKLFGKK